MSLASLETPRSTQYEETESEPEDLAPEREDEMGVAGAADPPLDSSDDEPDDDSELTTFESALPAGMCIADAPLPAQLYALVQELGRKGAARQGHNVQLGGPWLVGWPN